MLWEIVAGWFSGLWAWLTDFERGTLGEWFSGLASAAAVVVALYFARDARRVKLRVSCGIHKLFYDDPTKRSIVVSATNIGARSATITGVALFITQRKFARRRKCIEALLLLQDPIVSISSPIPVTLLPDSAPAKWFYPLELNFSPIIEELERCGKDVKALRCAIGKTHGEIIMIKLESSLIDAITEAINDKT